MQRFLRVFVLCALLMVTSGTFLIHAQEPGSSETKQETSAQQNQLTWKIVNTVIFAALLGWGVARTAPGFFNARSADIAKAIKDATGLKIDADFRYSEMDRKMATLSDEVKRMRDAAGREFEREHARIREETEHERERIRQQAEEEVETMRKASAQTLRRNTAEAALALVERRLRDAGPGQAGVSRSDLTQDFVHLVEHGAA